MKDSQVLRLARVSLKNKATGFICIAIGEVTEASPEHRERLKAWIRSMLFVNGYQYETYCSWLRHHHRQYSVVNYKEALPGRLAWLDWMIATLESEGK